MPRRETIFIPNHYYHIYNRGNNRETIFFEADNYLFFLRKLQTYLCPLVNVIAYCLMPNHYHLLVRIKTSEVLQTSEVSKSMMKLSVSYTKAINKRFERVGSLFQGAYHSKLIEDEIHLLHLCRYIHANPVKDGLVNDPDSWPYSNYLEWIGERDGSLIDPSFVESYFSSPETYREFVGEYLKSRQLTAEVSQYLNQFET